MSKYMPNLWMKRRLNHKGVKKYVPYNAMSEGTDSNCSYSKPIFIILLVKPLTGCYDVFSKRCDRVGI